MMETSNSNIGARVRKLRNQKNLTQKQLGLLVGTTSKHISEIERGVTGISIDMQIELRNALHCSIDYLLLGDEFETIDSILPDDALKLIKSNDKEKKIFLDYVSLYLNRRT